MLRIMSITFVLTVSVYVCSSLRAESPQQGDTIRATLGKRTSVEVVYIPPGEFVMGSTPEEKAWATGIEGGAQAGTDRESYEGDPRPVKIDDGFWMGRTEVTVGQFRRFVEATGYVTDAEQPQGWTQVFDHSWDRYFSKSGIRHPWKKSESHSWRDPNFGIPVRDSHPVVCVSYQDMQAFCRWLTKHEEGNGSLPEGLEYRLPTESEWAYACRGGRKDSTYFWWGDDLAEGQGRFNISSVDFLPGRHMVWPLANTPWSDGYAFMSPVDRYGKKGRNGFGLADMCGNVWEFTLDHFDPTGGHEKLYYADEDGKTVTRPVCRGGNYFDVPGNARCAVRLGILGVQYSDSRDGFRVCLGVLKETTAMIR